MNVLLISRRHVDRIGTRFHSRGIDENGNVSNFVETEQIIETGELIYSFVQIRGSIPLFWKQIINLSYNPVPVIYKDHESNVYQAKVFRWRLLRNTTAF